MSEYADGFDDGKGEKFDELMIEIVALREQLAVAGKAVMVLSKTVQMQGEQNVGYPERMMKDVENLLKEKNCG